MSDDVIVRRQRVREDDDAHAARLERLELLCELLIGNEVWRADEELFVRARDELLEMAVKLLGPAVVERGAVLCVDADSGRQARDERLEMVAPILGLPREP